MRYVQKEALKEEGINEEGGVIVPKLINKEMEINEEGRFFWKTWREYSCSCSGDPEVPCFMMIAKSFMDGIYRQKYINPEIVVQLNEK